MPAAPSPARVRRATLCILAVTVLWGWTFVWMKQGIEAGRAALGGAPSPVRPSSGWAGGRF